MHHLNHSLSTRPVPRYKNDMFYSATLQTFTGRDHDTVALSQWHATTTSEIRDSSRKPWNSMRECRAEKVGQANNVYLTRLIILNDYYIFRKSFIQILKSNILVLIVSLCPKTKKKMFRSFWIHVYRQALSFSTLLRILLSYIYKIHKLYLSNSNYWRNDALFIY